MNTIAIKILRYSFVGLFLWFGIQQLINPSAWVSYLPVWTGYLPIPGEMLVQLNGWLEVIACVFLALGILTRPVAIILGLHLSFIAWEAGGAIGVRDFALAFMGFTLAACDAEPGTMDFYEKKKIETVNTHS